MQLVKGIRAGTLGPSFEMSFYHRLSAGAIISGICFFLFWVGGLLGLIVGGDPGTLVSKNFIAPLVLLLLLPRSYFIHNIIRNVSLHSGLTLKKQFAFGTSSAEIVFLWTNILLPPPL